MTGETAERPVFRSERYISRNESCEEPAVCEWMTLNRSRFGVRGFGLSTRKHSDTIANPVVGFINSEQGQVAVESSFLAKELICGACCHGFIGAEE